MGLVWLQLLCPSVCEPFTAKTITEEKVGAFNIGLGSDSTKVDFAVAARGQSGAGGSITAFHRANSAAAYSETTIDEVGAESVVLADLGKT